MKKGKLATVVVGLLALAVGCSREPEDTTPYMDYVELKPRLESALPVSTNATTFFETLKPEDVLVAVNGYTLTKSDFNEQIGRDVQFLLRRKNANEMAVEEQITQRKPTYIENFVTKRLLIDDAKRRQVMGLTNVFKIARNFVRANAKARGRTLEKFEKSYPGNITNMYYEVAERVWIDTLIATNIPLKCAVDAILVSNMQASVEADNQMTSATNELKRLELANLKKRILEGKITLAAAANQYSADADEGVGKDGFWGEFERNELTDKPLRAKVFNLKLGEISDPIEVEEGYHLVKVLKIRPPEKNDKGRVIQPEIRTLAHIYFEKEPLLIRQDDRAMANDLTRQLQLQAIEAYVENLKTNGQNRVEWPHGRILFR